VSSGIAGFKGPSKLIMMRIIVPDLVSHVELAGTNSEDMPTFVSIPESGILRRYKGFGESMLLLALAFDVRYRLLKHFPSSV
jgi:hypothetical protein